MTSSSRKGEKSEAEVQGSNGAEVVNEAGGEPASGQAEVDSGSQRAELSPEARAKLTEIRSRLESRVGQLVLMLMSVPRYRHQTLADLNHLLIEPLLRDRIAIAHAGTNGNESEAAPASAPPVGVAIWASVGDAAHAKIQEQVKSGTFPVRLSAEEWASGEEIWLLDLIAPTRELATAVLLNFGRIAGERRVHLHPFVSRGVDPELLEKLKQS